VSSVIGSADAAQPVVQAITLPLYFVSGVFIPDPNLPAWMRHVADAFPVAHLVHALRHSLDPAVHGSGLDGADLAVLAVWAAGGLLFALRRFSWTPTARTA
jgi:ABC-2 type transport system permease protein